MATMIALPRYSAEDFDSRSVRSAAPSYRSEAPSYHSTEYRREPTPAYTPRNTGAGSRAQGAARAAGTSTPRQDQEQQQQQRQTIGLPPLPPVAMGAINAHSYRLPTWSTHNAPASRQYQSVIERRANAERERVNLENARNRARAATLERTPEPIPDSSGSNLRPLEDPYLVGERAAAQARRERLNRENGDDILIREDQQWDWLLIQMRNWDARERDWAKFRREVDSSQRKTLLRRIGGRLI